MSTASTPTASSSSRLAIRLDALPRDELLQLAAEALAELPVGHRLHSRTDALVARRKPLPTWCVDGVLLSPDLLPHLVDSLSLYDCGAAAACSMWAAEWTALMRRRRYIQPVPRRIDVSHLVGRPRCAAVLSDGTLCVSGDRWTYFMNAEYEDMPDGHALAALAKVDIRDPFGVLQHEDALLVVDSRQPGPHVRRLRMADGVELARSPALDGPSEFDVAGDLLFAPTSDTISVLDVHTLELLDTFGEFLSAYDCAVHNDELYVVDGEKRGELYVYSLDGQYRRTVSGGFGNPMSMCIRNDRIYLIERSDDDILDEDEDEAFDQRAGRRLLVIELDGTIFQEIRLPGCASGRSTDLSSLSFLGDELLITDATQSALYALRFV
tara:strand:- start:434 stop:1576 length:1143 start_codon:yes stop_codon:yes gene_type:complete